MSHKSFKRALVTGASSGIGEAVARLLADQGIALILAGRNMERLQNLAKSLSVSSIIVQGDLLKKEDRAQLIKTIHEEAPDLIINNAGLGLYGDVLTRETQEQLDLIELDVKALVEIAVEGARTLVSQNKKGVIINIASAAAWPIFPCFAVYSASKAFVNQFTRSFDAEVAPYGVRVQSACPGMVDTQFRARAGGNEGDDTYGLGRMNAQYAAEQIWKQIQSGKTIRIFDLKTRLLTLLARYGLPDNLVAKAMSKSIKSRHKPREIIKIPHG